MPRLAPSRGQVFDHVAFTVDDLDRFEARIAGFDVVVLDRYEFGEGRAILIEGPDRLAIELIEPGTADPTVAPRPAEGGQP
jgi:hypothetical protein